MPSGKQQRYNFAPAVGPPAFWFCFIYTTFYFTYTLVGQVWTGWFVGVVHLLSSCLRCLPSLSSFSLPSLPYFLFSHHAFWGGTSLYVSFSAHQCHQTYLPAPYCQSLIFYYFLSYLPSTPTINNLQLPTLLSSIKGKFDFATPHATHLPPACHAFYHPILPFLFCPTPHLST